MRNLKNKRAISARRLLLSFALVTLLIFLLCGRGAAVTFASGSSSKSYRVTGTQNYLALRSSPSYDKNNEIGKLYNGDTVWFVNSGKNGYWYVSTAIGDGYVNKDYLSPVSSGGYSTGYSSLNTLIVAGTKNYLALRSGRSGSSSNEIGKVHNNDTVILMRYDESGYWLIYAPEVGKYGYVNSSYLRLPNGSKFADFAHHMYVAAGMKQYLALRSGKAYKTSNETGKIYFGQPVELIDKGDSDYWYVYAPTLEKFGYVNKDYLIKVGDCDGNYGDFFTSYKVSGVDKYLALRKQCEYETSNEIGKIKEGQKVEYVKKADSKYWFVYAPTLGKFGYVNKSYLS